MESVGGRMSRHLEQPGERSISLQEAYRRGLSAARELGLEVNESAVAEVSPGAHSCFLSQNGVPVFGGNGYGKGDVESARVGALFEALEHYLSSVDGFDADALHLQDSDSLARGPLARDVAVSMLAEMPHGKIGCMSTRSGRTGETVSVPVFLSVPDYVLPAGECLRGRVGDFFDYTAVQRYSFNNGWASGVDAHEAVVHALNEVVERDAFSLLLIDQFLGRRSRRLRVVDPATLPDDLALLGEHAGEIAGTPIHLIDMTTELDVPAFLAFCPPQPGSPARVRGCGASLSRAHAMRRALTELVQLLILDQYSSEEQKAEERDCLPDLTRGFPVLRACRFADFTPLLADAERVAYREDDAPSTPPDHQDRLVNVLASNGFDVYLRDHYVTDDLVVSNVLVPGLERFLLITDGQFVLPGDRGHRVRKNGMDALRPSKS
ncbi:YcaO-like family protein [Nonomuraea glycinis]|uniref:YcaO domain-containing protein n=1 Tax=Nonomuraea glycinis TaxID=2047744 RepID=A0A918A3U6_9ACTN|nr:YcaO-like family protein [Nonomuraea glycinis]MCA2177840.1 YcaO-like family protein [Nonomuraea glycinis]GGP06588.1 hypothetical protein GCM10012278_30810 [Nonomuraea glycinis]